MSGHYKQRLENHILEVLTDILGRETRDPRVEGVVFTGVELNDDYSIARVFYMPPADGEGEAEEGLNRAASFMRGEVGRYLKMKTCPVLRFSEDDSLDRFNRIETLLDEGGEPAATADPDGAESSAAPAGADEPSRED